MVSETIGLGVYWNRVESEKMRDSSAGWKTYSPSWLRVHPPLGWTWPVWVRSIESRGERVAFSVVTVP